MNSNVEASAKADISVLHSVQKLLANYASIGYPLDKKELVVLLDQKINASSLESTLRELLASGIVVADNNRHWYALKSQTQAFSLRTQRHITTKKKIAKASRALRLLAMFPWIRVIVLTGSCAMGNASDQDDIDLMLIVSPNSLYVCRLYATMITWMLGAKRKRGLGVDPDTVCMNVWMDARNLSVPTQKRTTYSAREIIEAKMVVDKDKLWDNFLGQNAWIMQRLPNTKLSGTTHPSTQSSKYNRLITILNGFLRPLQIAYMKPHITNEIVSENQLWLHPQVRS